MIERATGDADRACRSSSSSSSEAGKPPAEGTVRELLEQVKIYNPVPAEDEPAYAAVLAREYAAFCTKQEVIA